MKHKRYILLCSALLLLLALLLSSCGKKEEEIIPSSQAETIKQHEAASKQMKESPTETTAETVPEEETLQTEGSDPKDSYFTGYSIQVNLAYCCITVYECYSDGCSNPIRSMVCSCGRYDGHETPEGVFYTSDKYEWGWMADGSVAQYVTRFNGDILFHAVPSWEPAPGNMEVGEYNKLGGPASLGCIRLCVADAAWIYYNMPWGTQVIVYYDYDDPGPLGVPEAYKIPDDIPQVNQWDPTDPDPGNPWPYYMMSINSDEIALPAGSSWDDLYAALSITDNYGNSVKHYAYIDTDDVDFSTSGNYDVYISIYLGYSYSEKTITVSVY